MDACSLDLLRSVPLFSRFSREEQDTFLAHSKLVTLAAKNTIYRHGDPADYFYVLCRGSVQVYRMTPDGHKLTSDLFIAGDAFPVRALLGHVQTHLSNARVVEDALLLQLKLSWLRTNLRDLDDFQGKLLLAAAERLYMAQVEAEHRATMKAPQLIACLLQQMCVLHDLDPEGFTLPYSKSMLASRLGIELETFSRALPKLKRWGIVVDGNRVMIQDRAAARAFVCSQCSVAEDCVSRKVLDTTGPAPQRQPGHG